MNAKICILALTLSIFLTACNKNEEVVQTVDWYKSHKVEREEVIAKCTDNPGELAATPNCVNASQAASDITWGAEGGIKAPAPLTFK